MIRRALISVSDKTGVIPFARALAARDIELLSTGGTLAALAAEDIPTRAVEDYTGSPEVMDGRVKTLHPRVHGGILARGDDDGAVTTADQADLERLGGQPIDLVVCNLYPFEQTVAKEGASTEEVVEQIDIGGPSMVRSAAKNHGRVTVVCDPADYPTVLAEIEEDGSVALGTRKRLAAKAFAHTAAYDGVIAAYLSAEAERPDADTAAETRFPPYVTLALERVATLRYGENPHQRGAWYRDRRAALGSLALASEVGGGKKELSFNNLVDLDAALEVVREFDRPAAAVIKHTNPCGLAVAEDLAEAYRQAREGDPLSAFGGIVALNRTCDLATAEVIAETFIEGVVAPGFDDDALARLSRKKKLRLVATGPWPPRTGLMFKRIGGGFVLQDVDGNAAGEVEAAQVATKRPPTEQELRSLIFCWKVCKHVKSNAIVLCSGEREQIVGVGAGQMSRVQSVHIACDKAGDRAQGSVLASDAFFPFPDGVEAAVEKGVTAVVQPGGSVKDAEVITAADAAGIAMVLTGARHFRH
ncbi:MAG: bifunctional phosphoribosylaminoimidazolecarboxamide formyltransferase/inosine monophosphate cyclohydrolase [Deltaproteobacteria bacterium]|nr:MAG: bifunctional phosphoribosylaminoimidazolecarboxamide formyltransferase/inosine monophosphate cyclohydrolase [Deltaproteobacteria bacterium]